MLAPTQHAGFSDANISGGKNDKESNDLCFVIIDFIEFFKPLTASFENVTGVSTVYGPRQLPCLVAYSDLSLR
jgi:hypothetical protein